MIQIILNSPEQSSRTSKLLRLFSEYNQEKSNVHSQIYRKNHEDLVLDATGTSIEEHFLLAFLQISIDTSGFDHHSKEKAHEIYTKIKQNILSSEVFIKLLQLACIMDDQPAFLELCKDVKQYTLDPKLILTRAQELIEKESTPSNPPLMRKQSSNSNYSDDSIASPLYASMSEDEAKELVIQWLSKYINLNSI
jgi:hypothetical protein